MRCAANLHSLTVAARMYADDTGEYLLVRDEDMNPYLLDLGLQLDIDKGHLDLRDLFESYLGRFQKASGPSPLMFCPSARAQYDRADRRVSLAVGTARWMQGHCVIGYAYWAANGENVDAISGRLVAKSSGDDTINADVQSLGASIEFYVSSESHEIGDRR